MMYSLHAWKPYALALGVFSLALVLRFLLLPVEAGLAYLTFYPGVVACALLAGWRPTLLNIALAALIGAYIFNPPHYGFGENDIVPITSFAVSSLAILALLEIFKRRAVFTPAAEEQQVLRESKLVPWLWAIFGLIVLFGAVNVRQHFREVDDASWVTRTHEVKTQIALLLADLLDAETGMRGYLITGDDAFLAPYRAGTQRVAATLNTLRNLTADSPEQQQHLNHLEPVLKQRMERLGVNITLFQRDGFAAAQVAVATGDGKLLQDRIRSILANMEAVESRLGQQRQVTAQTSSRLKIAFSIVTLVGAAAAALGLTLWRLMQELRLRRIATDQVRRLNTALAARADELETRVKLAARASGTGFWDWDLQTNSVYYSPEWKAQLGYADNEIANAFDEWQSRVHPDELANALQRVRTYLAAPTGDFELEVRLRHRDGTYHWILSRGKVQRDAEGKPSRMLGAHVDITKHKRTEHALRESRDLLQLFIEHAPVALAMFDRDMRYVAVSRQWRSDYLLGDREIIGHSHYEIFPEITDNWKSVHRRGLAGESIRSDEDRFERIDGSVQWLRLGVIPWKAADGDIGGIIIFSEDISARKNAEAALREKENLLSESQSIAQIGSWKWRLSDNQIVWSEETYRLYGVPLGHPQPTPAEFIELIHPEDRPAMHAWIENCLAGKPTADLEFRVASRGNESRVLSGRGELQRDAQGRSVAMVGTVQNITDRKRIEVTLRNKNAELERFTYMISHDLKSPLVTIKTFLSYLQQDIAANNAERIGKDMEFIATAAEKMGRMLEELLEFSRVGRIKTQVVQVSWREVVDEALTLTAGAVSARHARVEISAVQINLYGERDRFVQVWQNLIDNAAKFMGEQTEPTIRIGAETKDKEVTFFVCDNGVGIDPRYHEKIFRLFEKLDAHVAGTGLGLALVKRVVESYGGTICVESRGIGSGTCFLFTLPTALANKTQENST